MSRRVAAVLVAVAATAGALWLIAGHNHYPDEGPYVTVTARHGIHVGDVVILVLWALVMWGVWRWAKRTRRPAGPHERHR